MPIRVKLNRKFADMLNGIDLRRVKAGEELDLSARDAELLVAEGWASLVDHAHDEPPRRKSTKKTPPSR